MIITCRLCLLSEQEEHVIIACRSYLLSDEGELVRRKYWIHNVFWATEEEGEFGLLKGNRQKFCKYFRMCISKYENFKDVLPTHNRKKNTPRRSITTEEKLALTLRLVHIPYNTKSPPSLEQLNKSQTAAVFWLTTFVNVRVVAGRRRTWAGPHRPSRDGRC